MNERDEQSNIDTGMCPHGNFPNSCTACIEGETKIQEKETSESTTENESESKSKLREFMQSPLGQKIKRIGVYSWITIAALGAGEVARQSIKFTKQVDQLLSHQIDDPEKRDNHKRNIEFVESQVGEEVILDLAKKHVIDLNNEKNDKDVSFNDFDKLNIDDETLKKLWNDGATYPKNWINDEVSDINLTEPSFMDGDNEAASVRAWQRDRKQIFIINNNFSDDAKSYDDIDRYFSHELGHCNDWENKKDVPFEARISLLADVLEQIEKTDIEDMYGGFEGYGIDKEEEANEKLIVASETWAEMCEIYFSSPSYLKKVYPEAYNIVDNWIKAHDSDFDPFKAAEKRQEIISNQVD